MQERKLLLRCYSTNGIGNYEDMFATGILRNGEHLGEISLRPSVSLWPESNSVQVHLENLTLKSDVYFKIRLAKRKAEDVIDFPGVCSAKITKGPECGRHIRGK